MSADTVILENLFSLRITYARDRRKSQGVNA